MAGALRRHLVDFVNVDFYSGFTLSAIGIPTMIFALARTIGWVAHWNEMISSPYRLSCPRQLYVGPKDRNYIHIKKELID